MANVGWVEERNPTSPIGILNLTHLPHPKLSHNEKWSFGDLRLAIAT